jgi:anti-sigma-K factor RskA
MTGHDAFDDAPAGYALGALDEPDRLAFEAHLPTCAHCQQEVAELRRVAAALGASVEPVAPPQSLKARTLARAMSQTKGGDARFGAVPTAAPRAPASRLPWLAAAAAVLLAAGLGIYASFLRAEVNLLRGMVADASERADSLRDQVNALRRDSARLTHTVNVLSAPNLMRVDLKGLGPATGAIGRAYLSRGQGLVFAATGLPALREGRVYQLWVIPPAGRAPISAGLLTVDGAGASASLPMPAGAENIGVVAVTDEPAPAGSSGPTTSPILAGAVGG